MKQHSDPIEFLIEFASNHGANSFVVNNAKDELKKLRQKLVDSYQKLFNCNQDLTEALDKSNDYNIVGWSRLNNQGDLYDPRFCYNPHINEDSLVSLYVNTKEIREKHDKLSK